MKDKILTPPPELAALATSIAIALSKCYSPKDNMVIKSFLSAICSSIGLIEEQRKNLDKSK